MYQEYYLDNPYLKESMLLDPPPVTKLLCVYGNFLCFLASADITNLLFLIHTLSM